MGWVTGLAIFFIIWWTVLFAILPIGMRSQSEEGTVVPGSEGAAPAEFRMVRKAWQTTLVSLVVFAVFYVVTEVYGIGPASFPNIFDHRPSVGAASPSVGAVPPIVGAARPSVGAAP